MAAWMVCILAGCGQSTVTNDPAPAAPKSSFVPAYVTWKNDNGRTGLQPNERQLTPANVKDGEFEIKFSNPIDGWSYAQPLYVGGLVIAGARHNVVFVATENNTVYAFDAERPGPPLWQRSFLGPGITTVPSLNPAFSAITNAGIGITSTPVIDTVRATIYVFAQTVENGAYANKLHALSLFTGEDILNSPVLLTAPGYDAKQQFQRSALLLANGKVYIAFASYPPDLQPYNGWVFAVDAASMKQVASWRDTVSDDGQAGIWMSGAGPSADENGNIYVTTGNGAWDGIGDFGMTTVQLDPALHLVDYFTPYNAQTLSATDHDLGSGGVLLLPPQPGAFPHQAIICGKPDSIFVLNRDNMGQKGDLDDRQIIQTVPHQAILQADDSCFTTPAFFNNTVYLVGNNDVLRAFSLDPASGNISLTAVASSGFAFRFPGAQPAISSNGTNDGIVWAIDTNVGGGHLHAFDAADVSRELYRSPPIGDTTKFSVPTVINGKVYVATKTQLVVFGLKPCRFRPDDPACQFVVPDKPR